ncbi:unnamed protein product [Adineta ricciae]|uniref:PDZ domain-containing protein n=1 Tax=Adineta ricciae TaxID=249248 RepID=A0A813RSE1_ADIRI|nr:unnamed protein product [Adineta ricciae]CAF1454285.1 unnamed protein product [Adineta ricciae]
MVSTNNPWHLLHEQLMQIEDKMNPSAPYEKFMRNIVYDNQWLEFDIEILIPDKVPSAIVVQKINQSIVITNFVHKDGLLHPFDIILSLNDMNFVDMPKEVAQCILNAHQGKLIKFRIRRLQPTALETIELNLQKNSFFDSAKLGFTLDGGVRKAQETDPGLFVVGIKPRGRAANNGRLRIGDRLIQISSTHVTVNLQCLELDQALKLIKRMRNESTSVTLVIAHQTQN